MRRCNILTERKDSGVGSWPRTEWVAYLLLRSALNEVVWKKDNDPSNPANDIQS